MTSSSPDYFVFLIGIVCMVLRVLSKDICICITRTKKSQSHLLDIQVAADLMLILYGFLNYDLVIGIGLLALHLSKQIILILQGTFRKTSSIVRSASFIIPILIILSFLFTSTYQYKFGLPSLPVLIIVIGVFGQTLLIVKYASPLLKQTNLIRLLSLTAPLILLVYSAYRSDLIYFSINSYLLINDLHRHWISSGLRQSTKFN